MIQLAALLLAFQQPVALQQLLAEADNACFVHITTVQISGSTIATADVEFNYKGSGDSVRFTIPRGSVPSGMEITDQRALVFLKKPSAGGTLEVLRGKVGLIWVGSTAGKMVAKVDTRFLTLPKGIGSTSEPQFVPFDPLDQKLVEWQVSKAPGQGVLVGNAVIGPLIPVESVGKDVSAPFATLQRYVVEVKTKMTDPATMTISISPAGNFAVALNPGQYFVLVKPDGMLPNRSTVQGVRIKADSVSRVRLRFDTGIR